MSADGHLRCFHVLAIINSAVMNIGVHVSVSCHMTQQSHYWAYTPRKPELNWCFWIVVLEKTVASPLVWKEIKLVHHKGNQSWIFIGRTEAEAETPILLSLNAKNWLSRKDPDAGKAWRQEENGTPEDEMVGWHHWLNGHEFGWTLGVRDGQGALACCSPQGCKESDTTE